MPLLHRIEVLLYLLLTLLVIGMLARLTWSASRRPHGERTELLAVVSASLAIYLYSAGYYHADLGVAFGVFNLLTLVLVRPLFVGLAYDVRATLRISGILGILGGAFFLAKAFAAEVLGQPFWLLGRSDIIALGAVVLVAVPFLLHRATPVSEPPSLTHAQRLALYLLEVHNKHPESPGVTSAEIQEALGISPNNVAGEIRRAEKMLREHADATENLVDSQVRGVRGRKFFRLTEGGQAAAHAVLRGLPRDPEGGR